MHLNNTCLKTMCILRQDFGQVFNYVELLGRNSTYDFEWSDFKWSSLCLTV